MISIKGQWYDGRTSAAVDVVCRVYDSGVVRVERISDGELLLSRKDFDIDVCPRLANTQRYLVFPGGEKLETDENDHVDQAVARFKKPSWLSMVHKLESHWRYVLVALVILLLFLWGGITYGIPWAAKMIAQRLPPSIMDYAGGQTLEFLDNSVFAPSEIDAHIRQRVMTHFAGALETHAEYNLDIKFRKGQRIGANAFALPNGTIIFTDEMIALAVHDDELLAVLIHEIGHVVHRHGMRTLIQDSILGFVLLAITGDVSGSSELFLGLPVLLTELAYSREFEREADQYALSYMRAHDIAASHFASLMQRIDKQQPTASEAGYEKWFNYLSTHPLTEDRLKAFEK